MKRIASRILGPGALSFPTWAYAVFFFVIPVALVLWYSFGYKPDAFTTVAMDRLSFDRYGEALSSSALSTFLSTLRISILGTLICLLIAVPFSYWLAVKVRPERRGLLLALVMVPFWTNFLVRTLGWQIMLSSEGFVSKTLQALGLSEGGLDILYTRAAVQIGVVYNYLPLMILPLFVAMDAAGRQLREASYDLGAGPLVDFLPSDFAAGYAGCGVWLPACLHSAQRRLRDGDRAWRSERFDGWPADCEPVQHGPELGARFRNGRDSDACHTAGPWSRSGIDVPWTADDGANQLGAPQS